LHSPTIRRVPRRPPTCRPPAARPRRSRARTNFFAGIPQGDLAKAECTPLHRGRTTTVWQTRITRGDGKLAAIVTQNATDDAEARFLDTDTENDMDVRAAVAFQAGKPLAVTHVQLEGPKARRGADRN
jgi:hypothetical protein